MEKKKYNAQVQDWMQIVENECEHDAELTLTHCNRIIEYGNEIQDNDLIAFGYYHLAVSYYVTNHGNLFYEAMTKAVSYLCKTENYEMTGKCYNLLGISYISRGNVAVALDCYLNAIEYCKMAKAEMLEAVVQINVGVLDIYCGRYADAISYFEYASEYFSRHAEIPNCDNYMVCIYENMAKAYLMQGELIESKCCFERIYAEHKSYCDEITMVTVYCAEALYYHITGNDKKCEERIAQVHNQISEQMPIMDMFDDFYDYCKMILNRGKEEEFWRIINIMEPMVESLDMNDLYRRLLGLKLKCYRRNQQEAEYLKAAGLYYELSERAEVEYKTMMSHALNLRKNLETLNHEKKEVEEKNILLQKQSETDQLSGLNNRFRLNNYSEEAFQRAVEKNTSLTVEILDIDNFKEYNDWYGHQRGDECIQQVSTAIKSMEELGAFTARYGGDEFILIYEGITKDQSLEYAAELRKRVMNLQLEHPQSRVAKFITISQGVCWDIPLAGNRMWDYLHAADNLLYRVKQKKRNNFCIGNLTESSDQIIMSYL